MVGCPPIVSSYEAIGADGFSFQEVGQLVRVPRNLNFHTFIYQPELLRGDTQIAI